MIVVNWFDVYVQTDHPDEGADPDSGHYRGDDGPGAKFSCLEKLDTALDMICLPPLSEWEPNAEEPGLYHMSKNEDGRGCEITDEEYRADPSLGLYLVDYTISVSVVDPRPFTVEDIKKEVADG